MIVNFVVRRFFEGGGSLSEAESSSMTIGDSALMMFLGPVDVAA